MLLNNMNDQTACQKTSYAYNINDFIFFTLSNTNGLIVRAKLDGTVLAC